MYSHPSASTKAITCRRLLTRCPPQCEHLTAQGEGAGTQTSEWPGRGRGSSAANTRTDRCLAACGIHQARCAQGLPRVKEPVAHVAPAKASRCKRHDNRTPTRHRAHADCKNRMGLPVPRHEWRVVVQAFPAICGVPLSNAPDSA